MAAVTYATHYYQGRSVMEAIDMCANTCSALAKADPKFADRFNVTAAVLRLASSALKAEHIIIVIPMTVDAEQLAKGGAA